MWVTRCQKILHRSGTILILLHLIDMKQVSLLLIPFLLGSLVIICAARTNSVERIVDLKTANGTILKGTYFDAANQAPACCCSIKATARGNRGTMSRASLLPPELMR